MPVDTLELWKLFWHINQNDFRSSECKILHNLLLPLQMCYPLTGFFRNESYIACIRLAVIDYNVHVERTIARNKEGDIICQRKYRKQTKKWDVTLVRCPKKYSYMKDLVAQILKFREPSDQTTRSEVTLISNHPHNIQLTISHIQPPETSEILSTKQSRF